MNGYVWCAVNVSITITHHHCHHGGGDGERHGEKVEKKSSRQQHGKQHIGLVIASRRKEEMSIQIYYLVRR